MNKRDRLVDLAARIGIARSQIQSIEVEVRSLLEEEDGRPPARTMTSRIVSLLHQRPDREFDPSDIASCLGLERNASLLTTLGRLVREGRICHAGRGRYCGAVCVPAHAADR